MSSGGAIGIMGGSFDPIHHGHLLAASEVADRLDLASIVFVPAGQPWQKSRQELAAAEDRYAMTIVATAGDSRFSVSRMEIDRLGPSYTVDTLKELHQTFEPSALYLITGADALAGIQTWHQYEEIVKLAHLVGVSRPGHLLPNDEFMNRSVTLIDIPGMAVSATDIRQRIMAKRSIRYLVPAAVESYIRKHQLYRVAG